MDHKEIGFEIVGFILMAQEWKQWGPALRNVMNLRVL